MIREPYYMFIRLLEKIVLALPPTPRRGKMLFIACFPKSGSTYLSKLLERITGFPLSRIMNPGMENEHDIGRFAIGKYRNLNVVVQQHMRGSKGNVLLLKKYGVKPIVLVRNIFDVVPSRFDHVQREGLKGPWNCTSNYVKMTDEEKLMHIIRNCLPWYFGFLATWKEASSEIETFWTSYEDLFADQVGTVARILEFQGISVDTDLITTSVASMSSVDTLHNKAVSGRGQDLPDNCRRAILEIAKTWKMDDETLARVGLSACAE